MFRSVSAVVLVLLCCEAFCARPLLRFQSLDAHITSGQSQLRSDDQPATAVGDDTPLPIHADAGQTIDPHLGVQGLDAHIQFSSEGQASQLGWSQSLHGGNLFFGAMNYGFGTYKAEDNYKFYQDESAAFDVLASDHVGASVPVVGAAGNNTICMLLNASQYHNSSVYCGVMAVGGGWTTQWIPVSGIQLNPVIAVHGRELALSGLDAQLDGFVFIYTLSSRGTWMPQPRKVADPSPVAGVPFGDAIAFNSDLLFVGTTGGSHGSSAGRVDIFERTVTGAWTLVTAIQSNSGVKGFGHSLSLSADRLIVGAPGEAGSAHNGSVHVYSVTSKDQLTRLCSFSAHESEAGMQTGYSVASETVNDETVVLMGAPGANVVRTMVVNPVDLMGAPVVRAMAVNLAGQCIWRDIWTPASFGPGLAPSIASGVRWGQSVAFSEQYFFVGAPFFGPTKKGLLAAAAWCRADNRIVYPSAAVAPHCEPCPLGTTSAGGRVYTCSPCPNQLPANATWGPLCSAVCSTGFFGPRCLPCTTYMDGTPAPANAHWVDGHGTCMWQCNPEFRLRGEVCCPIFEALPEHAHWAGDACGWECDDGYSAVKNTCVQPDKAASAGSPGHSNNHAGVTAAVVIAVIVVFGVAGFAAWKVGAVTKVVNRIHELKERREALRGATELHDPSTLPPFATAAVFDDEVPGTGLRGSIGGSSAGLLRDKRRSSAGAAPSSDLP